MPYYRSLRNLDNGIRKGEVFAGTRLKTRALAALEELEIIARIAAPPLSVLPGWKERADSLNGMDAEQFLDTADVELAQLLSIEPAAVTDLKRQVIGWLAFGPGTGV
jgi:hypothetical protein